jgi:hypothetical protein
MNTKVLSLLSVFMLFFSLVVFFNRNVEGFDPVADSYNCIGQQIPSKCRLIHSFWKDYQSNSKGSYKSAMDDIVKCSNDSDDVAASAKIKALLQVLNIQNATEKYSQYTCNQWNLLLNKSASPNETELIGKVNTLEGELLNLIKKGESISDANLTDEINTGEAKDFLKEYCANSTNSTYSSADVIKALWCKLSCGRPDNELEDLNAPDY